MHPHSTQTYFQLYSYFYDVGNIRKGYDLDECTPEHIYRIVEKLVTGMEILPVTFIHRE